MKSRVGNRPVKNRCNTSILHPKIDVLHRFLTGRLPTPEFSSFWFSPYVYIDPGMYTSIPRCIHRFRDVYIDPGFIHRSWDVYIDPGMYTSILGCVHRSWDVYIDPVTCTSRSGHLGDHQNCLLYTSPSPRDLSTSRMPSSA